MAGIEELGDGEIEELGDGESGDVAGGRRGSDGVVAKVSDVLQPPSSTGRAAQEPHDRPVQSRCGTGTVGA